MSDHPENVTIEQLRRRLENLQPMLDAFHEGVVDRLHILRITEGTRVVLTNDEAHQVLAITMLNLVDFSRAIHETVSDLAALIDRKLR